MAGVDGTTDFAKIKIKLPVYLKIMDQFPRVDVTVDQDFQRMFNGYYRIRQRSQTFYEAMYSFLENHKYDHDLTYHSVLHALYSATGRIERSFSSKVLATVRPECPVWDRYVINHLGLKPPAYSVRDMSRVVAIYNQICAWYQTDEAKQKVDIFDAHFPGVPITDTKKIDFILWQTR